MADNSPDVRIGTAERERAFSLLSDHYAAGRLGTAEFDERSATITSAVTRGQLVPLFSDLPGGIEQVNPTESLPVVPSTDKAPGRDYRAVVMALVPLAALVLFFVTGTWLWFLAVPAAGAILFAGRDTDTPRRERRRDR